MNKQRIACDTCGNPIGYVNLDTVKAPVTGFMFKSIMPERGVPDPFPMDLDWHLLHCRICRHRAFGSPNHITLIDDRYAKKVINIDRLNADQKLREKNQTIINEMFGAERVEKPTPVSRFQDAVVSMLRLKREPEFKCRCGNVYKHQSSLIRHQKECNGR